MFDETCTEHAKSFAKVCIKQYFEDISGEIQSCHDQSHDDSDDDDDKSDDEEDKLLGIRRQDTMNKVLWDWHTCKPALSLRKYGDATTGKNTESSTHANNTQEGHDCVDNEHNVSQRGFKNGYVNAGLDVGQSDLEKQFYNSQNGGMNGHGNVSLSQNGFINGGIPSPCSGQKKAWAVYYSKV